MYCCIRTIGRDYYFLALWHDACASEAPNPLKIPNSCLICYSLCIESALEHLGADSARFLKTGLTLSMRVIPLTSRGLLRLKVRHVLKYLAESRPNTGSTVSSGFFFPPRYITLQFCKSNLILLFSAYVSDLFMSLHDQVLRDTHTHTHTSLYLWVVILKLMELLTRVDLWDWAQSF